MKRSEGCGSETKTKTTQNESIKKTFETFVVGFLWYLILVMFIVIVFNQLYSTRQRS